MKRALLAASVALLAAPPAAMAQLNGIPGLSGIGGAGRDPTTIATGFLRFLVSGFGFVIMGIALAWAIINWALHALSGRGGGLAAVGVVLVAIAALSSIGFWAALATGSAGAIGSFSL